jgi:glycogen debranching enzyme
VPDFNRTIEITVPIHKPGVFAFYTTYSKLPKLSDTWPARDETTPGVQKTDRHYINVGPRLELDGSRLPVNALSVCSVLSKLMGKYPNDWERHLRGISGRGFNMVHFTPLQIRGESNSPFSLYDQLGWDPDCFPSGEKDIQALVDSLRTQHSLLSLSDVVLNHTANNSLWLQDHPEAGYNLNTAPHLEAAYLLDTKLLKLSASLPDKGLPTEIKCVDDLMQIMDAIKTECIGGIRLWEFYALDVDRDANAAVESWAAADVSFPDGSPSPANLKQADLKDQATWLIKSGLRGHDRMGERHRRKIDPKVGAAYLSAMFGRYEGDDGPTCNRSAAHLAMVKILDAINVPFYDEYDEESKFILQQIFNRCKYLFLEDHGPKLGPITLQNPLIESYFTRLPRNKKTSKFDDRDLALANNGWVWGGNALVDNAGPDSRVYLRREVIVWGDCVKLRYGEKPEDSPWLWDYMSKYVRMIAKYFVGMRIDNAHSTPIHVAEYMLDEARRERENLYVVAELFTGSNETDYVFVKRLGFDSLVREAMQSWSTSEMSRLVHRHGGRPIGSFEMDDVSRSELRTPGQEGTNGDLMSQQATREVMRSVRPVPVHALFMDCTHDNETPAQKRDARDTLPNMALVAMCGCAIGSVMGYDEVYPRLVDLVNETRHYTSEASERPVKIGSCRNGIQGVRKMMMQIHGLMGKDGYDEMHVHHEDQYITVHRVHPESRKGYFLIAHTAYPGYGNGNGAFNPVYLPGTRARHLGCWMLDVDSSEDATKKVLEDPKYLRGLPSRVVDLAGIRMDYTNDTTCITVRDKFPPGSIALFETWIPAAEHSTGLDTFVTSGGKEAFAELDLVDINFLMYRCDAEERDASGGQDGVYDVPNCGPIVYAGLQGWWSHFQGIIRNNDLGHPLCQNLRDGPWALDYTVGRLQRASQTETYSRLKKPAQWLDERCSAIRKIPSFLLPRYFAMLCQTAYRAAWDRGLELMHDRVKEGQWFLQSLAMVSVQQTGLVKSASLYPNRAVASLAAGLPHFAVSWARCWGRDVCIAMRGLLLGTGRYAEAKEHILAFASVLKHGLIPNLLGAGATPRYNARDACWFFMQCVQDYVRLAPDGNELLKERVKRRFLPYNDTWFDVDDSRAYSKESTIAEVIQESMQRHASGISFREANAGPGLDMQMKDEGFNIEVKVDWDNGFIFGGSRSNCGTWMDKMGESERAGSKGVPGTPRDGGAVEINGLAYSTIKWLSELSDEGNFPHTGVKKPDGSQISFADWAALMRDNFERCYYIPVDPSKDSEYDVNSKIVNRRGIYKDLYRSAEEYEDYQLRPNFAIAMTVAPDLFNVDHAINALCVADDVLRGPTGMATLDPSDNNYRPYYVNSEDSDDFATSKGRNYHQGPEWLWPTGFHLRAMLKFLFKRCGEKDLAARTEAFQQVTQRLAGCKQHIKDSPWAGLTELTQKNGDFCGDSVSFLLVNMERAVQLMV